MSSRRSLKRQHSFFAATLFAGLIAFVTSFGNARAQSMNNMPGMEKGDQMAEQKTASGIGTVTALNVAGKKITLDHAPLPAINWPAMKMEFPTAASVDLSKVKVGDKVRFTLKGSGNNYTVQSIGPAQ